MDLTRHFTQIPRPRPGISVFGGSGTFGYPRIGRRPELKRAEKTVPHANLVKHLKWIDVEYRTMGKIQRNIRVRTA